MEDCELFLLDQWCLQPHVGIRSAAELSLLPWDFSESTFVL